MIASQSSFQGGRVVRATDLAEAVLLAAEDASRFVEVFVPAWAEVDRQRDRVAELGLSERIAVHHCAALHALVRLQILAPSPKDPPEPPGQAASMACVLRSFVRAASALCRAGAWF